MKPAAAKAYRQSIKNRARNVATNENIAKLLKTARKNIIAKKWDAATESMRLTGKALDKAVARGIVKKNTAARLKSRMHAAFKKAKTTA